MEDKDKIASFIANHNIIRPIEYPLIAMPFLTTLTFVFYIIFYIVSSDKTSGESVLYIVGVIFSIKDRGTNKVYPISLVIKAVDRKK